MCAAKFLPARSSTIVRELGPPIRETSVTSFTVLEASRAARQIAYHFHLVHPRGPREPVAMAFAASFGA